MDGPSTITGVVRQAIPFKRLALTDIVIKIQRSPRLKTLVKAFTEANVLAKWEKTGWARKQAIKKKRASLNDFDRFKVMLGRKEVSVYKKSPSEQEKKGRGSLGGEGSKHNTKRSLSPWFSFAL